MRRHPVCTASIIAAAILFSGMTSLDIAVAQNITATDELSDAVKNLKALHLNSDKVDWPTIEAHAEQMIVGKEKSSDAYPAIYSIIVTLGEKHTHLIPADNANAMRTGIQVGRSDPPTVVLPEAYLLEGRIGLLRLPREFGNADQDTQYTRAARSALAKFASAHVCRFIVDLRGNSGGSMAPMINGVTDLLGIGPYGYFLSPQGSETAWTRENSLIDQPSSANPQSTSFVAILLDKQTASAGEFTAIAFQGRSNTKTFGEPTYGYVSTNIPHKLPDGALLAISTGWSSDRLHRPYKHAIVPDEITDSGQATVDQAIGWLSAHPCKSDTNTRH